MIKLHFKIIQFVILTITLFNSSLIFSDENKIFRNLNRVLNGKYDVSLSSKMASSFETQVKIGFDKTLNDKILISANYINYLSTYDYAFRTTIFKNRLDASEMPINLFYKTAISLESDREVIFGKNDKLNYLHQFIINYKLNQSTNFTILPTYVHQNLEKTKIEPKGYPWDFYFLGLSIKHLVNKKIEISGTFYNQFINDDFSAAILKTSYEINLKHTRGLRSYGLSFSNLSSLSSIGLLSDMGMRNTSSLRVGFQLNQQLEIKNKKNEE